MTATADEICVVLSDGTILRWSGERAADIWNGMLAADGEYLSLCHDGYDLRNHPELAPTITKPLRKTTFAYGHVEDTHGDEPYISGAENMMLADVLPEGTRGYGCKKYRFRFEVEAEELKP